MPILLWSASVITNETSILYLRIIWWSIVCFLTGRGVGKTVDIQYREIEGKPKFIKIAERRKWIFHFRYFAGTEVVREGLIAQIVGYTFSTLELAVFFLAVIIDAVQLIVVIADWLVVLFATVLSVGVLLPMQLRYQHHMKVAYDCDWITHLQENLTIYPKRRCRIISKIGPSTYEIVLGRWGKKKRLAKTSVPVVVGTTMYAVHSNEQGSPFWTIKNH